MGNNHYDDHDSIDLCDDEFIGAQANLSVPQEDFVLKDLDLESDLVKKHVLVIT